MPGDKDGRHFTLGFVLTIRKTRRFRGHETPTKVALLIAALAPTACKRPPSNAFDGGSVVVGSAPTVIATPRELREESDGGDGVGIPIDQLPLAIVGDARSTGPPARTAPSVIAKRRSMCECLSQLGQIPDNLTYYGRPISIDDAVRLGRCGLSYDPTWCESSYPGDCNKMFECHILTRPPNCPTGMRLTFNQHVCAQVCGQGHPPCPAGLDCWEDEPTPICASQGAGRIRLAPADRR